MSTSPTEPGGRGKKPQIPAFPKEKLRSKEAMQKKGITPTEEAKEAKTIETRTVEVGTGATPRMQPFDSLRLFNFVSFFMDLFDRIVDMGISTTQPGIQNLSQRSANPEKIVYELLGKKLSDLKLENLSTLQLQRIKNNCDNLNTEYINDSLDEAIRIANQTDSLQKAEELKAVKSLLVDIGTRVGALLEEKVAGYKSYTKEVPKPSSADVSLMSKIKKTGTQLARYELFNQEFEQKVMHSIKDEIASKKNKGLSMPSEQSNLICITFWDDLNRMPIYINEEQINDTTEPLNSTDPDGWRLNVITKLRAKFGYKQNGTEENNQVADEKLFKFSQLANQASFGSYEVISAFDENSPQQYKGITLGFEGGYSTVKLQVDNDGTQHLRFYRKSDGLKQINVIDKNSGYSLSLDPKKSYFEVEFGFTINPDDSWTINDLDKGRIKFEVAKASEQKDSSVPQELLSRL